MRVSKQVTLRLVYREFGVSKLVALDDIPHLATDIASTFPNPLTHPKESAFATALLLAGIKSTLAQGAQQIDKGLYQRSIEAAAIFVGREIIDVARREPDCDEIRVTVLDTAQLRHGVMVPDLKIGAYPSKGPEMPPLPRLNVWLH